MSDWAPNGGKRCRAICTVNQPGHRAEYRCEEWRTEGDPPLCWTHRKAIANADRTVPLPTRRPMNHYLFLDLDGVCNSHRYFFGGERPGDRERNVFNMIDPSTIPHLNAICEPLGVKVVISSSIRLAYRMGEIRRAFRDHGLRADIIGKTGYSAVGDSTNRRGIEIGNWLHAKWLTDNEPCRFVILDDSADMGPLLPQLVQTTWGEGLLAEHVEPALKILRGE